MPKKNDNSIKFSCYDQIFDIYQIFDELYALSLDPSNNFTDLIDIVLSKSNIILAYRNLKSTNISFIGGNDGLTIKDLEKLSIDDIQTQLRFIAIESKHGYRPKPVIVKNIEKPDFSTKPFGIPCIWDRLLEQCIKQVLEPICEAKFSDNSYGYRPYRSVENAISKIHRLINFSHLSYCIQLDLSNFFESVNHSHLISQIWNLGIQDKTLLYILKQMLTNTPLKYQQSYPEVYVQHKESGIVQSGILYGLFTNIVLNELDKWIESQWELNPVIYKYSYTIDKKSGMYNYGCGYRGMRNLTKLKEMYLVRFGEDFVVFCANKDDAIKTLHALQDYVSNRLKLDYNTCKVINLKHNYCKFLGFEVKMIQQKNKYVVKSRMSEQSLKHWNSLLKDQIKRIQRPKDNKNCFEEIRTYNNMVMSIHNYYKYATNVSLDCDRMNWPITIMFKNRLGTSRLSKTGRLLTDFERSRYGQSKQIRYEKSTKEPIFPIGYIKHKNPIAHKHNSTPYTEEGRKLLHIQER